MCLVSRCPRDRRATSAGRRLRPEAPPSAVYAPSRDWCEAPHATQGQVRGDCGETRRLGNVHHVRQSNTWRATCTALYCEARAARPLQRGRTPARQRRNARRSSASQLSLCCALTCANSCPPTSNLRASQAMATAPSCQRGAVATGRVPQARVSVAPERCVRPASTAPQVAPRASALPNKGSTGGGDMERAACRVRQPKLRPHV